MDDHSLKITELINKSEVASAMHRYFRALDEKNFDAEYLASIFTAEAKVTRPNGASLIGPKEISASHEKSFARFERIAASFDGARYLYTRQSGDRSCQSRCDAHVAR
jgi:hypothetical protein